MFEQAIRYLPDNFVDEIYEHTDKPEKEEQE